MSSKESPYPKGNTRGESLAWEEALRQRKRAERLESENSRLRKIEDAARAVMFIQSDSQFPGIIDTLGNALKEQEN